GAPVAGDGRGLLVEAVVADEPPARAVVRQRDVALPAAPHVPAVAALDEGGVAAAVEQQDHLLASLQPQAHRVDQLRRQHVLPPPPTRSSPTRVAGRRGGASRVVRWRSGDSPAPAWVAEWQGGGSPTRSSPAPAWVAGWRRGGALAPARGWGGAGAASHVDHSYRRQRPALDALRQLEQPELARLHVVPALERRRRAAQHAHRAAHLRADDGDLARVVPRRLVRLLVRALVFLVHDDRAQVLHGREHAR